MSQNAARPAVSLDPDDFTEGGGGLPFANATVVFTNPKFEMFDYGADKGGARPTFGINYVDYETKEDYGRQNYSVGSADQWTVDEEGNLIPLQPKPDKPSAPSKSSNFGVWITELINAGFPKERIKGGDITVIANAVVMMKQVPAPKVGGVEEEEREYKGKEYAVTIIVPGQVKKLPEENAPAGKGKGKGKSAPAAAAGKTEAAAPKKGRTDEGDAEAVAMIVDCLSEAGPDGFAKKQLTGMVMQRLRTSPNRNAALFAIADDTFLSDGPWSYEAGMLKSLA